MGTLAKGNIDNQLAPPLDKFQYGVLYLPFQRAVMCLDPEIDKHLHPHCISGITLPCKLTFV